MLTQFNFRDLNDAQNIWKHSWMEWLPPNWNSELLVDCCNFSLKSCVMRFDSISTCFSVEKQMYHNFLSRIKRVSLTKWVAGFCEFFIDPAFGATFVAFSPENAEMEHISWHNFSVDWCKQLPTILRGKLSISGISMTR